MPPVKRSGSQRAPLSHSFTRNCTVALVCGYAAVVFVFSAKYSLGVADYEPPRRRAVPVEYISQDVPDSIEATRLPVVTPHVAPLLRADAITAKAAPVPAPVHAPAPLVASGLRGARTAENSIPVTTNLETAVPKSFTVAKQATNSESQLVPAPLSTIVEALLSLAALPEADLKRALDPDDAEHNYFGLPVRLHSCQTFKYLFFPAILTCAVLPCVPTNGDQPASLHHWDEKLSGSLRVIHKRTNFLLCRIFYRRLLLNSLVVSMTSSSFRP